MKKDWYKSKSVWAAVLLLVAGLGGHLTGEAHWAVQWAEILGLPLAVFGLRKALP